MTPEDVLAEARVRFRIAIEETYDGNLDEAIEQALSGVKMIEFVKSEQSSQQ